LKLNVQGWAVDDALQSWRVLAFRGPRNFTQIQSKFGGFPRQWIDFAVKTFPVAS
jgi:hypothetical protein